MRHGAPARIITNQGMEFVNEVSRALNTLMVIRHIITTPYNPQANGKVEGANRTIKDMLSMYVQGHQRDWDKYLQIIAFQYNTTINVATGYSPFYVMHGREARQPSDQWIEEYWQAIANEESLDTLIGKITRALRESWMVAATNIEAAHLRQDGKGTAIAEDRPARVGTKRVMGHFRPGDTFYMRTLPQLVFEDPIEERQYKLCMKLQNRYHGPHRVLRQVNPVQYKCMVEGKERMVHVNKMKRDLSKVRDILRVRGQ